MRRRSVILSLMAISSSLAFLFLFIHNPHVKTTPSKQVRIGVLKHESSLPIYIADEKNLFKQAGVSVRLLELPPSDHLPALLSKRVDVISPTTFPLLFGIMGNNPKLIYAIFPGAEITNGPTVYGFVVSKSSSIAAISDLKNKRVIAINIFTKSNIESILTAYGLAKADWPEILVATRDASLQAIKAGRADAAIMDQPALAIAVSSGEFTVVEPNPRARFIANPYWSGSGAVLVDHWNTNKTDLLKVINAIDNAITYIRSEPKESNRILAKRLSLDGAVAQQMGGYFFPKSTEHVNRQEIMNTSKALLEAGILKRTPDFSYFFPPNLYQKQQ